MALLIVGGQGGPFACLLFDELPLVVGWSPVGLLFGWHRFTLRPESLKWSAGAPKAEAQAEAQATQSKHHEILRSDSNSNGLDARRAINELAGCFSG